MKDQVTTIEQSKRLMELGISAKKASCRWESWQQVAEEDDTEEVTILYMEPGIWTQGVPSIIPAFTVVDLLGILPIRINVKDDDGDINYLYFNMSRGEENWEVYYSDALGMCELVRLSSSSLIDCFIGTIKWLLSNGYKLEV